jgi:hypothetical protein
VMQPGSAAIPARRAWLTIWLPPENAHCEL